MAVLRWGLIGCGDIARKRVAPALRDLESCRLVAVSRAQHERAEQFAREFGAERWYKDWRELLKDEEIDAVYIATPPHLHAEQTIAAAEAAKHVICEKPMALDSQECRRMIAACRGGGVRLSIAYYRHFYPVVARIKELLAAGEIGKVVLAEIRAFENYRPEPDDPKYWVTRKERAGGGPLMDFGCHRIEVLLNIMGAVSRAWGSQGRLLTDWDVEDTSISLFEFQSESKGMLAVSRAVEEPQDSLDIYGSAGSIHVPVLNGGSLSVYKGAGGRAAGESSAGERREDHPPHENLHLPYIQAVTRAFLENSEPPVPGETGLRVAEIIEEIYGS
ncbi:MAG: Gfo/Idh/MocA family oxidoreductase [Spirochaetales bacterium]|nr:Gfo/Idh/MocA family oxidoreductase [Spirochaetales bacterium]